VDNGTDRTSGEGRMAGGVNTMAWPLVSAYRERECGG